MSNQIKLLEQAMGTAVTATGAIFVGSGAIPDKTIVIRGCPRPNDPLIVINVIYRNEDGNYVAVNSAMPKLDNDDQREILLATLTQTIEEIP